MQQCVLIGLLYFLSFPAAAVDYAAYGKVAASVVRVAAKLPESNSTSFGSGVVLPDGRVVTNCHVIPGTGKVIVMEGALGTEVERGPSDPVADLCVLNTMALTLGDIWKGDAARQRAKQASGLAAEAVH